MANVLAGRHCLLVEGLLGWLDANLERFYVPAEHREATSDLDLDPRRQAFSELALLCWVLSRHPMLRESTQYGRFIRHLLEATASPSYGLQIVRNPQLFPAYLMEFACLRACGESDPERHQILQRIIDFGFITGIERTAWNQMDLLYFLDLGGFRHTLPDRSLLYRTSSAFRLPPIPFLRAVDIYALTHILFFGADFGRRDLQPLLGERFAPTREQVGLLLGMKVNERDWDLVAELALCCTCLEHEPATLDLAFDALSHVQLPDGDIPGWGFDTEARLLAQLRSDEQDQFLTNYHPTMVALAASTLDHLGRG